jgi:hypothetical protein
VLSTALLAPPSSSPSHLAAVPGINLMQGAYADNQADFPISDDILWHGLSRNLAFSVTGNASLAEPGFRILRGFMRTWSPVCGGGVVWGCLFCPAAIQCSDAQKNSVTNLLVLLNAVELVALGFGDNATQAELVSFSRRSWRWLQQAANGVAGLVDPVHGIVYDKLRPVLAAPNATSTNGLRVYHCCAGGCANPATGEISYAACELPGFGNGVGCGALNPNTDWRYTRPNTRQFWAEADCRANLGGDSSVACGGPGSRPGAGGNSSSEESGRRDLRNFCTTGWAFERGVSWPASWSAATPLVPMDARERGWLQSPTRQACVMQSKGNYIGSCCETIQGSDTSATADCGAIYTYNQGLLIGVVVTMDRLQRAGIATISFTKYNHSFGLVDVAVAAFNATLVYLEEHGCISDGPLVKEDSCADRDNFWFRAVFFWNTLKLYLHLRSLAAAEADDRDHYQQVAATVKGAILRNWVHVSRVLFRSKLSPNDWFATPPPLTRLTTAQQPGFEQVGAGNCLPNTPNIYSYNCSSQRCATVCINTALCTGYDWSTSGNSLGSCRARLPVCPPAGEPLPDGFRIDPSNELCSNVTGSNNATDGATCYRKLIEPSFQCPPKPPPLPPPPPPPPPTPSVGCFKTQMALYWLALAAQGAAEKPDAASTAMLYRRKPSTH